MKKVYIKRLLTIVSLIVIPLVFVMTTQNRVDHNTLRIQGFYQEERNSLDVVFIGSSHVYTGYAPGYAYGKFGYTSYNISVESNRLDFYQYQIKEVFSYQNPKLFVIDVSEGIREESDNEDDKAQFIATLRKYTDSMPLSMNKVELVNEFADKEKMSFFFPFIMYHGQLSNIGGVRSRVAQDLRGTAYLKGEVSTNHITNYSTLQDVSNDYSIGRISAQAENRLNKLLSYCRNIDAKVLFVIFPHRITCDREYTEFINRNYMEQKILAAGFDIINFDRMLDELQLNPESDYYDNEHLNAQGQKKMTEYFGALIMDKYQFTPIVQSASNQERWEKSYRYIKLFQDYFQLHKNDAETWWYEKPSLIRELDALK